MPRPCILLLLAASLVHSSYGHARTFTRCQLSRELLRYNFPRSLIAHWVCVIEHASGRTTEKVTNHNNAYTSYGLFQCHITDYYESDKSDVGDITMQISLKPISHKYIDISEDITVSAQHWPLRHRRMDLNRFRGPRYGLTQINNKDWCKKGRKGGHCNMKCEDLLNEDLADDVRCAKRIYDRVGFKAWPTSYAYCKEKSLPDLSRC